MPVIITWSIFAVTLFGTILNILEKKKCFVVWFVTNIAWIIHNIIIKEYAMVAMFSLFALFNIWGYIRWCERGLV